MSERFHESYPEGAEELIRQYLLKGSVEKVLFELPDSKKFKYKYISVSTYNRLLTEWGIVRTVGRPRSVMAEALFFFTRMVQDQKPLETVYRQLPSQLKTSLNTLYRIFNRVLEGRMRRYATALFVTPEDDPGRVLIGQDFATPRPEIGKQYGFLTVPATFCSKNDKPEINILRVLQQEVFTNLAIKRELPLNIIPNDPQSFGAIKLLDVKVFLYHIPIPGRLLSEIASPKIDNFQWAYASSVGQDDYRGHLRAGMQESFRTYKDFLDGTLQAPEPLACDLNIQLVRLIRMAPSLRWA